MTPFIALALSLPLTLASSAAPSWCPLVAGAVAQASAPSEAPKAGAGTVAGRDASVTIVPVLLAGVPSPQVAEVIGMMLERGGMSNLELGTAEFRPPAGASLDATATSFAEFVKAHPISTAYGLFTDIRGTPGKGCDEILTVLVARDGTVAWKDLQNGEDELFRRIRPREPLQCCVVVAQDLVPVFGLDDPTKADARPGKLAKRWAKETGLPSREEMAEMGSRAKQFAQAPATNTLLVIPPRTGVPNESPSADGLVTLIDDARLLDAVASATAPSISVRGNMNEQKVLWEFARQCSEAVAGMRPETDYVLFTDYLLGREPDGTLSVGAVHTVICDRAGELVAVDFQNDHGSDFQAVKPRTIADCNRLVLRRLTEMRKR